MIAEERTLLRDLVSEELRKRYEKETKLPERWRYTRGFCRYCGKSRLHGASVCAEHKSLWRLDRQCVQAVLG